MLIKKGSKEEKYGKESDSTSFNVSSGSSNWFKTSLHNMAVSDEQKACTIAVQKIPQSFNKLLIKMTFYRAVFNMDGDCALPGKGFQTKYANKDFRSMRKKS